MHLYAPTQSNAPKAPSPGNRPYNAEAMSAWQPTFKEHCNMALSRGVAAIKRASGRYFPSKKHSGCPRRHSIAAERPATGKAQAEPRTERNQRPAIGEEPHPHGRPAARSGSCKRRAIAGRPIPKRNSERMLEPEGECGATMYRASDTAKPKAPARHEACNAHTAPEGRVGGRPRQGRASTPGGTVAAASSTRGDGGIRARAAPDAIASVSSAAIAR